MYLSLSIFLHIFLSFVSLASVRDEHILEILLHISVGNDTLFRLPLTKVSFNKTNYSLSKAFASVMIAWVPALCSLCLPGEERQIRRWMIVLFLINVSQIVLVFLCFFFFLRILGYMKRLWRSDYYFRLRRTISDYDEGNMQIMTVSTSKSDGKVPIRADQQSRIFSGKLKAHLILYDFL